MIVQLFADAPVRLPTKSLKVIHHTEVLGQPYFLLEAALNQLKVDG